jgi:hypothetical protein
MALRFAMALSLMSSIVAKRSPLSPSFRFRNSLKSHEAISGEYGGYGTVEIFLSVKNCRTAKGEWHYSNGDILKKNV